MEPGNVRVPEENPALGRAEQAEDRLDQGRLARPVRSDQDDHLSLLQGHRDSVEDLHFPIAGPEVLRLEQHAYPRGTTRSRPGPLSRSPGDLPRSGDPGASR